MNTQIENIKKGDKVRINHMRKGTFEAEIISNEPKNEWLSTIVISEEIKGLVNTWIKGETLNVRKSLINTITLL